MAYKYLFGPVPSRRLGISLGVDLVPHKVCSLNCIYCEVGATNALTLERREYVPIDDVLAELEEFLAKQPQLDCITFSGSGEPTLNSGIGRVVSWIKKHYPQYRLVLITNGTLFYQKQLRDDVQGVDLLLPSLDAVSDKLFHALNRPHADLNIEQIIDGLVAMREQFEGEIWLELFISPGINDNQTELMALRDACERINPDKIQLNTLDRPGAVAGLQPITPERMQEIAALFEPLPVEIIARFRFEHSSAAVDQGVSDRILELVERRPCTEEDLAAALGVDRRVVGKYLGELLAEQRIKLVDADRGNFYALY